MPIPPPSKPGSDETARTMLRLLGGFAAPAAIYLVVWEAVARWVLPNIAASGKGFVIDLSSVLIPCVGVLASIFITGVKAGRMLGGGVMAVFFLILYFSSGVAFSWSPVGLTFAGIALAWGLARFCPTMKPDLSTAFG
ncbi:hypothetical protein BCL93_103177 [Onishia taeanensis]|uniref:Uncharacterized protein n=2 Tax=Oceanospirillales TaxID=135619 RepID=A0A328XUJ3_9GAMM|nr:hypothetical protein BCL93_103177 [Halomonas taeanensis]